MVEKLEPGTFHDGTFHDSQNHTSSAQFISLGTAHQRNIENSRAITFSFVDTELRHKASLNK